ncbi:MAG: hypothetical protein HY553_18035 [Elusimicrobia bacterium]|nr:hypothetical protein [Elusimicrobiota bacterium]
MKHWMLAIAAAVALAPWATAHDGHDHGKAEGQGKAAEHAHKHAAGPAQTFEGEIIDMACYMAHDGKGEKHAKCAQACLVKGMPAGLLTGDGKVFLLLENHSNPKGYTAVKKLAGEKAKVTGSVVEKSGISGLMVTGAEKAK